MDIKNKNSLISPSNNNSDLTEEFNCQIQPKLQNRY